MATATATRQQEPSSSGRLQPPGGLSDRSRKERNLGWKLCAPAVVIMIAVTAYPMINAVYLSLFNYRLTDSAHRKFVGLSNYGIVLKDKLWWQDVLTTLLITVITVIVELIIGFAFALVMHRIIKGRRTVRTAILLPYGIITVVSAYAWKYAFASDSGFVNSWFGFGTFDWFGHTWSSLIVICLSEIWKTTPFIALLLLAGLSQVPDVLLEAASVDGATTWQRLRKVILPNMKASIMVAALFRTLAAWAIFDNIFIMTGGSQKTESLSFLTYRQTVQRVELGLGSSLSVLLFITVVLLAFLFVKGFKVNLASVRSD